MRFQSAKLAIGATALGLAGTSQAGTLYGATYLESSALYTLDQMTGAATLVGAIDANVADLTGIGNRLIGVDITANALVDIDVATGAKSSSLSITGSNGAITALAYNAAAHTLYGSTTGAYGGDDALYTIDLITGAATRVGAIGILNIYSLGFDANGHLLGAGSPGNIYTLDLTTGAAALLGASGTTAIFDIATRPEDGVVFAASIDHYKLLTIDPASGAATAVGGYGANLNIAGLAFVGSAVPEPSAWVMLIGGFGLTGMALRRRRGAASLA